MFLNGGKWEGKQIVSSEWIKDSVTPHMALGPNTKYGLKWWLYGYGPDNKLVAWSGNGFGGQQPFVLPEHDIVAVYTAWNIKQGPTLTFREAMNRLAALVTDAKK